MEAVRVSVEDDARFEREYAQSNRAVDAVAEHLRAKGLTIEVVAARDFVPRSRYRDEGGDLLVVRQRGDDLKVEVKGRRLRFTGADDFPFDTIIVDRANKSVELSALYVSVNEDLTVGAFIPRSTRPHWVEQGIADRKRGYGKTPCFVCPKEYVSFVMLERRP